MAETHQGIALEFDSRKYISLIPPQKPIEQSTLYEHPPSSPNDVLHHELRGKGKKRGSVAQLPSGAFSEESISTNNSSRRSTPLDHDSLAYDANQEDATYNWWQEYGIPPELQLVQAGTPQELCSLFKESLNHTKAIQASLRDKRMDSSAVLSDNPVSSSSGTFDSSQCTTVPTVTTHKRIGTVDSTSRVNVSHPGKLTSLGKQPDEHSTGSGSKFESVACNLDPTSTGPDKASAIHTHRKYSFLNLFRRRAKSKSVQPINLQPIAVEPINPQPTTSAKSRSYKECASCFDDVSKDVAIGLSCQHYYCSPCFSRLVSTAILSEHTFPPKCCLQQIPEKTLKRNLASNELLEYKAKEQEYSVSAGNRWFCASSSCGKWFEYSHRVGDNKVTCPHCRTQMCSECRGPQHGVTGRCARDQALDATLELAEQNGWRRCYQCQALVELVEGCRRMTCRCGAMFCYTCGARLGTCRCLESDEFRRQIELRQRRKVQEAETAQINAAIAAVEEAVRQENERQAIEERRTREASVKAEQHRIQIMESRMAEEIRIIQGIEAARLRNISQRYGSLHQMMARLHDLQIAAMRKRHSQVREDLVQELNKLLSRERGVNKQFTLEVANFSQELAEISKAIHEEHAKKTIGSNCGSKEEAESQPKMLNEKLNNDAENSLTLEKIRSNEIRLLPIEPDQEISDLNSKKVHPYLSENLLHNQQSVRRDMEEYRERKIKRERTLRAEALWLHAVIRERLSLLFEDQQRLERSGGEVRDMHRFATSSFDGRSDASREAFL